MNVRQNADGTSLSPQQQTALKEVLLKPLVFTPVYHNIVWGGRKLAQWRGDLPDGVVGESWEIADQARGMSVLADGVCAGMTLHDICAAYPQECVGDHFNGGDFPLLIKIIDANDRLSVQVHPDDALAQKLGVGMRGKTECWYMIGDGGELFQGCTAGTTRSDFAAAIADNSVAEHINAFTTSDGDFFFMPARTVHALGTGCLLFEVQQNCDCTFRAYDWGRMGLDGKPRQLHVEESLQTINFETGETGAVDAVVEAYDAVEGQGVQRRLLTDCAYFMLEEFRTHTSEQCRVSGGGNGRCSILMNIESNCVVETAAGAYEMPAMSTCIIPACAGAWTVRGAQLRFLHTQENV